MDKTLTIGLKLAFGVAALVAFVIVFVLMILADSWEVKLVYGGFGGILSLSSGQVFKHLFPTKK